MVTLKKTEDNYLDTDVWNIYNLEDDLISEILIDDVVIGQYQNLSTDIRYYRFLIPSEDISTFEYKTYSIKFKIDDEVIKEEKVTIIGDKDEFEQYNNSNKYVMYER